MSQALLASLSRTTRPLSMLRRFLALDALVTGANGLAYLGASGPLGELFGVDSGLLVELGVLLTAYAVAVAWVAGRPQPPALGVKLVVDVNILWTVLSVVSLAAWLEPTTAGVVWTLAQALAVAGFAVLQWSALRAATP
ncbi:hypothetical protein ABZ946_03170 [Streptomyces sp. NPDC046324]|uniref:hypothetical protein n=1 Tax=Streptomyces sp. NPDC046324 TaxID=3154915 RepID=UPI0033D0E42F